MKTHSPRLLSTATAASLLMVLSAAPSAAQQEDARWLPLTGCWQPVGEPVAQEGDEPVESELLCVTTNAQGGVDMLSYEGSELLGTVTMIADGRSRDVEREGCSGTETAEFAEDGWLLNFQTTYACDGEFEGSTAGLIAMVTPYEWINVQTVESDGDEATGVMRYMLANNAVVEAAGVVVTGGDRRTAVNRARMSAGRALDVDEIITASATVHPQALEALIVEQDQLSAVTSEELLRMADAGVAENVIDMAVAVSHPTRFAIQQDEGRAMQQSGDRYDRRRRRLGFFPGSFGHLGWSRYGGYGYGFGYSPFAYTSLYGYGNGYGGYGGYGYGGYGYGNPGYRPVIVVPPPSNGGTGRAVNGRGYTRGSSGGDTGRRATGAGARATGGTGSSSGGSAATSRGSGSTRSTGSARKAKRRGGSDF